METELRIEPMKRVGSMWNSMEPPQNQWAGLNRSNHTCQKHKAWTKEKYVHIYVACLPVSLGHPKRWRVLFCSWTLSERNRFPHLHLPDLLRWVLWAMNERMNKKHHFLCLMKHDYPNTSLATPCKWKYKGFFEQPSQRLGNHRTVVCHTCRGVRSLRKMIYHEVWDLSQLQTAESWFGKSFFTLHLF